LLGRETRRLPPCPSCAATVTTEMSRRTTLGYRMVPCRTCRRICNERTSTPFHHRQVPTDIALLVLLWRLQDKLSLRNVAEMVLMRGVTVMRETVRAWEERLAPLLTAQLKARRRGKAGRMWHVDKTYVRVEGSWASCRAEKGLAAVAARGRSPSPRDAGGDVVERGGNPAKRGLHELVPAPHRLSRVLAGRAPLGGRRHHQHLSQGRIQIPLPHDTV